MRIFIISTAITLVSAYSFSGTALAPLAPQEAQAASALAAPVLLSIPSIGLASPVVPMGLDSKGRLDVPSGNTNNVGWYAKGVVPGNLGSAVMDAHVFAAFKRLNQTAPGDRIDVVMQDGSRKRFIVTATKTWALGDLSPDELFNKTGGAYLHLITCAGRWDASRSDYTHRLIVYATLIE